MIYTLTVNPSLDYYLGVDKIESDSIIRANNSFLTYGGKGINVSAVLTRLGLKNKALGFVGGFTGDELINKLNGEGIDNDFIILTNGETRINVKIKTDAEYDINAAGAPISKDDFENLLVRINSIKSDDYLIISGSLAANCPDDIYERISEIVVIKKAKLIIDTSGKELLNLLKFKPFLIKPNTSELGELFDTDIKSEKDVIIYSKRLQELGALNVLVSRGENGAILLTENGEIKKIGAISGNVINTTGCGDSMIAGFIAGFIQKGSYDYALKLATACSAATAFSRILPTKSDIEKYLEMI